VSFSLGLRCSLLLYAILACSARLLRLLNPSRSATLAPHEEKYQHECIQLLIPILNDAASAIQDEGVLATIVILRMSEQYDEYHIDRQYHLVAGAFWHFNTSGSSSTSLGGLREATFYSCVRADIRMAILGRCSTRLQPDNWQLDTSSPINDADWANRMTWLLVQAINLCYGQNVRGVLPREQLEELVGEWKARLPSSFEPYFYQEADRDPFPVVKLLTPWHSKLSQSLICGKFWLWFDLSLTCCHVIVVGLQFYHASKILLGMHHLPTQHFSNALQLHQRIQVSKLFRCLALECPS
jgi:hypothetical protein